MRLKEISRERTWPVQLCHSYTQRRSGEYFFPFVSVAYRLSYLFMSALARTSVAKLLCTPTSQHGTSNVLVWHHGFSPSSFSITLAKCSDHPFRGNFAVVVSISCGWMR